MRKMGLSPSLRASGTRLVAFVKKTIMATQKKPEIAQRIMASTSKILGRARGKSIFTNGKMSYLAIKY